MATTRKKKADVIESADIAEMPNKPSGGWPKIVQGTHLTVKTFEDGRTELVWDDEALLQEVRAALSTQAAPKPQRARAKKNV